MAREREGRYPDASALAADVEAFLDGRVVALFANTCHVVDIGGVDAVSLRQGLEPRQVARVQRCRRGDGEPAPGEG